MHRRHIFMNLVSVCPANGAVVERGFLLVNLITNGLRSSMNVHALDDMMTIHYHGSTLSDNIL